MLNKKLAGLYAITNSDMATEVDLTQQVEQALKGGVNIVQYRDKTSDQGRRLEESKKLLELCRRHSACFIINDDVQLAAAVEADGVHLGRDDQDIGSARAQLGSDAILGVSCYNRLDLAIAAQDAGVDYVAFGRFFPSNTKPQAVQAEIELLTEAKQALHIPIVAIGGITPENSAALIEAGADMLAVIQGLFGQQDVRAAAEQFNQQFSQKDSNP